MNMNMGPFTIMCGEDLVDLGACEAGSDEYTEMITRLTNTFSETEYHLMDGMQQYTVVESWLLFGASLVEE